MDPFSLHLVACARVISLCAYNVILTIYLFIYFSHHISRVVDLTNKTIRKLVLLFGTNQFKTRIHPRPLHLGDACSQFINQKTTGDVFMHLLLHVKQLGQYIMAFLTSQPVARQ